MYLGLRNPMRFNSMQNVSRLKKSNEMQQYAECIQVEEIQRDATVCRMYLGLRNPSRCNTMKNVSKLKKSNEMQQYAECI